MLFSYFSIEDKKEQLLEAMQKEAILISKSLKYLGLDYMLLEDNERVLSFYLNYLKEDGNIQSIILSRKDKSLLFFEEYWFYTSFLDEKYVQLEKEKEKSLMFYSPFLKKEVFHFVWPIIEKGEKAYIHISFGLKNYNEHLSSLYKQYLLFLILLLFLSLLIAYFMTKLFIKPIITLNDAAKRISIGNLNIKVDVNRDDELGELANTFNIMLFNLKTYQNNIEQYRNRLEQKVRERTSDLKNANKKLELLNTNLDLKIKEEINKRKEQEELLIHQSRLAAMGEMISMIAHQWRQPLNTIGVLIQNLYLKNELNVLSNEDFLKDKDKAFMLIQRMSTTIDDFRNFFKPNKSSKKFDLSESISKTILLMNASCVYYNIKIIFEEEKSFMVKGLENELSQVLLNILSNAKDAIIINEIKEGIIKIYINEDIDNNYIYIEDNAGGIKEDIIHKVFEPYFSTKSKNGTGLGLYMSKMIIEKSMNGKLEVENKNEGALFKITLIKK